ncbi:MAG: PAS domain S-box protein [Okeania sp. SIO3B5]|uniref:PAS domain S-box protein n=1 Tax=Okeania sp. SIO3B5 TaxID=2607811 RepID=UPI0013FF52E9|nr:PAS domain S-box protein [Okeania sp. SIO3B5]NEO57273.1 PAS domain S-box protein [Okeania sp. SIO3B5]
MNNDKNTILIVDNCPHILSFLSEIFRCKGYRIKQVNSGKSALKYVINNKTDLILMDVKKPEIDGYQVCRQLKGNPNTHNIPVIFMSDISDTTEIIKGFEAGGIDYISKPIQGEEILARIEAQLKIKKLHLKLEEKNKQLEKEIELKQKNEDNLSAIITNMSAGLMIINTEGKIVFVNQATELLWEKPATELIDEEIGLPLVNGNETEIYIRQKSGKILFIETQIKEIIWEDDKAYLLILREVTESRREQEHLKLLERAIFTAPQGIVISDLTVDEHPVIYANSGFEKTTGYSISEVIGRNCRFLQGTDKNQPEIQELREAIATGKKSSVVLQNTHKDGSKFWNEVTISPVHDDFGTLTHYVAVQVNVTDRVVAQQALQESEARFRSMADGIAVMIRVADTNGNSTFFNQTWLEFTRDNLSDTVTNEWLKWVHPDYREHCRLMYTHSHKTFAAFQMEYRLRRFDGKYRWVVDTAKPRFTPNGTFAGYISAVIDITERKEAEIELSTAKYSLEKQMQRALVFREITHQIRSCLEPEQVYQTAANQIARVLHTDRCLIHTYSEFPIPRIPIVAQYQSYGLELPSNLEIPILGNSYTKLMLSQDLAIATDDIYAESLLQEVLPLCKELKLRSMMAIRTSYQGKTNGAIGVHQCSYIRHWKAEEIELLEAVAAQVGVAIAQVNLLAQEKQQRQELSAQNELLEQEIQIRRQVEESLKKSEERWQLVLKGNNEGIYDWNITTNEAFLSSRLKAIWGYKDHEIKPYYNEWYSRIHPGDREMMMELMRSYLKQETPNFIVEHRILCKDGSYKWVLARGQALWDSDGTAVRMVGSLQDINDRKQIEEALRESEIRYRELVESQDSVLVCRWKPNGAFTFVNRYYCQFFGKSSTELLGSNFLELMPDRIAQGQVQDNIQSIQKKLSPTTSEYQVISASGERRWVSWTNQPIIDRDRRLIEIQSFGIDITEKKEREEALRFIVEGTASYTGDDFFNACVHSLAQVLQLDYACIAEFKEAEKKLYIKAFWGSDEAIENISYPIAYTPCEKVLEDKICYYPDSLQQIFPQDTWLVELNIESYWGITLCNSQGQILGLLTVMDVAPMDINSSDELILKIFAARVGAELERLQGEVELKNAKETAEAANHAKSNFLASMTHELRTPLNAILGFSQLLVRDNSLNEEQIEQLKIINRSGDHLLNLINDILSMSKIEAGRITLTESCFDLHELLQSIKDMMMLKASKKGLQIIFEVGDNLPKIIKTDEGKLRQVLINILGNAVKFTSEGKVTLSVFNHHQIGQIKFTITDTGPGIETSEINNLFEPFVQTKTGRKSIEGTGLGLPISREFVHLMGGDISVISQVGKGTTFTFDIVAEVIEIAKTTILSDRRQIIGLEPHQPVYRILVVEDVPENSQLLIQLLQPLGFKIKNAENGKQAISIWQTWQPHLILMDIIMPVMNGYEATKIIKQTSFGQATTIIALTANAFDEDRDAILAAGCDDFIAKPFSEDVLLEKLASYLGVRYLYQEITSSSTTREPQIKLTKESLNIMPPEWLEQLHFAALSVNDQIVTQLIQQIPETEIDLINCLTDLVENFRLDVILELIESEE